MIIFLIIIFGNILILVYDPVWQKSSDLVKTNFHFRGKNDSKTNSMVMIWKSMSYAEEAKEEEKEMLACDNYVTFTKKKKKKPISLKSHHSVSLIICLFTRLGHSLPRNFRLSVQGYTKVYIIRHIFHIIRQTLSDKNTTCP